MIWAGALITFAFGITNLIDFGDEFGASRPGSWRKAVVAVVNLALFAGCYAALAMGL